MALALPSSDRTSGDLVIEALRPALDSGDALGGGPLFLTRSVYAMATIM